MATSTQTTHIRVVEGREVPLPGRWALDPVHSQIQFVARHMMISKRDQMLESGGFLVSRDVRIQIDAEAMYEGSSVP